MKKGFLVALLSLGMVIPATAGTFAHEIRETKAVGADAYWSTVNTSANAQTLFNKISALINTDTTTIGYDGLWDAYKKTDQVPGTSKIWDMYGGFQFTFQSGGKNYSDEGDCYNREHSIPKSWWGKTEDERYSDIIHLVPTDGYVNNRRSNYAFGEVANATYTWKLSERRDGSNNVIQNVGYSKLGTAKSINGVSYSGSDPVFEPADDYKGDFARIYYYFATRYGPRSKIATSGDGQYMFTSDSAKFYMTSYGRALMNKWHVQDPVSQKEIDRNNGVEETQGNRNPYVDHPEWADKIYGSNYEETHGSSHDDTPHLSISTTKTNIAVDESVTLTATVQNMTGTVQWYVEDSSTDVITLSATSGNSITVTGVGAGTKTVWAYLGTVTDSIDITVSSSGSGGDSPTGEGTGIITFGNEDDDTNINSASVNGLDSLGNTWYITTVGTTSYTPNADYAQVGSSSKPASSITFTMSFDTAVKITAFSISLGGFSGTAGTVTLKVGNTSVGTGSLSTTNDVTVEATNRNATSDTLTATITSISKGVKVYSISYTAVATSQEVTLSSISLNTTDVKKHFVVGDSFEYTGLIVTAHYSDSSSEVVNSGYNVSSPNMVSAGNKTVTVTYSGKTATYEITVASSTPTSITATVENDTYYAGDTITSSDITVKDNLNNTITDFEFSDHQFLYSESGSNGSFELNELDVTYGNLSTKLEIYVGRRQYKTPSTITDTITAADLVATTTNYLDFDNVYKNSDATYKGQSAKDSSGNIQLRSNNSNSGIVSTSSGGTIKSVTIEVGTGSNTVQVYGKNTAYSGATDLYSNNSSTQGALVGSLTSTGTINFTTPYSYVGIRSSSGAIYLSSIAITYGEDQSATNVANFIMYKDEQNQCVYGLPSAIDKLNDITDNKEEFWTSNDYVIKTARERLKAWAVNQGTTLSFVNNEYIATKQISNYFFEQKDSSTLIVVIALSAISLLAISMFVLKYKKKEQ